MAILYWNEHTQPKLYNHHLYKFDIHNWRMMRYGRVYIKRHKRDEIGVLISAQHHIRFIPHATISELLEYNKKGEDFQTEKFHLGYSGTSSAIAYCPACKGVGKFDWIQATTPARQFPYGIAPMHFIRDEQFNYVHPDSSAYVFAKVRIQPGDVCCQSCNGFGIILDSRYSVFKGLRGLKKRLVKITP